MSSCILGIFFFFFISATQDFFQLFLPSGYAHLFEFLSVGGAAANLKKGIPTNARVAKWFTFSASDPWRRQVLWGFFSYNTLLHFVKNQTNKTQNGHLPYWQKRSKRRGSPAVHRDGSHVVPWPCRAPVCASFNNKNRPISVWLTPGSRPERWPHFSEDATQHKASLSHTACTETRVKRTQGVSDNTGFSWLTLARKPPPLEKWVRSTAHLVCTRLHSNQNTLVQKQDRT